MRPEKDLQFDVGLTTVKEKVSYGVRGFYALVWDYIMPVPGFIDSSPPGFIAAPRVLGRNFDYFLPQWRSDLVTGNVNADTNQAGYLYANVELATLAGGDLFAEVRCRDWLSLYGSMAYVRGTNWTPVVYSPRRLVVGARRLADSHRPSDGLPNIYPLNGTVAIGCTTRSGSGGSWSSPRAWWPDQTHVAEILSEVAAPGFAVFALRGYYQPRENLRLCRASRTSSIPTTSNPVRWPSLAPTACPCSCRSRASPSISAWTRVLA